MADKPAEKNKAPEVPKNPTPKERFLQVQELVREHNKVIDNPVFQIGLDHALLEYQNAVSRQTFDNLSAIAAAYKIQGAVEFIALWKNLSQTTLPARRVVNDNLHQ